MANYTTDRTFTGSGTLTPGMRVKYTGSNTVAAAGVGEVEIGTVNDLKSSYATGTAVGVRLRLPATLVKAGGAFADGAVLRRLASGKVDDTGEGAPAFIALAAATADGDEVEALQLCAPSTAQASVVLTSTNGTAGAASASLANLAAEAEKIGDDVRAIHAALVSAGIIASA